MWLRRIIGWGLGIALGSMQAHGQALSDTAYKEHPYPDHIYTRHGRHIACRVDVLLHRIVYTTLPDGKEAFFSADTVTLSLSPITERHLQYMDKRTVELNDYTLAKLPDPNAKPKERVARAEFALSVGYSRLTQTSPDSATRESGWFEAVARNALLVGGRIAVTVARSGVGGYAWFSTRRSDGIANSLSGDYRYYTYGLGLAFNKPFRNQRGYINFNVGFGAVTWISELTDLNVSSSFKSYGHSGYLTDLTAGGHFRLGRSLVYIGPDIGISIGTADIDNKYKATGLDVLDDLGMLKAMCTVSIFQ